MRERQPLESLVLNHIREQQMIPPGGRVAVAVSGGADSVALLRVLAGIRSALGVTLCVAHFDHRLRGVESDEDARFVAELASAHGIDLFAESADVAGEADRNGWNLEDAARRLRYAFFRGLVEQQRATHVAVAHTADDQAETMLAQMVRGTGPTGLAGIYPAAGPIVRPLLTFRRQQLREYLATLGQTWREDSTNTDSARLRSRIRFQLMPRLQEEFSSRIVEHLSLLAHLSREEQAFWEELVESAYCALVQSGVQSTGGRGGKLLTISVPALLNPLQAFAGRSAAQRTAGTAARDSHRLLTERLIRRLYRELKGDCRGLTFNHVEQVIRLAAESTSGKRLYLPGSVRVQKDFENVLFSLGGTDLVTQREVTNPGRIAYQYAVSIEGNGQARVPVREIGICFCLKTVDWGKTRSETTGETQVLDIDSVQAPLILRNWLPGDAYTPCGRSRPRKLKELLLAARVPTEQRSRWPVLESAGRLIWARRMPAAREYCASERTRVALVIEEEGIE